MRKIISTIVILTVIAAGFYFLSKLSGDNEIDEVVFEEQEAARSNFQDIEFNELQAEIIKQGTGEEIKNGDNATVHYAGVLQDGAKFDSSLDRGQPFVFTLGAGQVIKGWDLGIVGMKVGEIRRLYIPSDFGYGETGTPGGPIPPNANLVFEVELLSINN